MPFFLVLALLVASIVIGELLRPKVRDTSKPASLKQFDIPTAEETRAVPVVWGTVLLDQPNVVWFGDLQTVKLTKRVRTGLFSVDRLPLGFRYSIGMQFALCHGPLDELIEVRTDNKVAYNTPGTVDATGLGQNFTVDARTIYGGDSEEQLQAGGEGGVYATCTFYKGSGIQTSNPYLDAVLGITNPGYRRVSYIMWNGPSSGDRVYNYDLSDPTIQFTREPFLSGYVGDSPSLKPFSFVVKRTPNLLSGGDNTFYNINGDANPADVIYELLTNDIWACGISTSLIDADSFKDAQEVLFNEGLGFSAIWDTPKQINEIIDEILSYIDGVVYTDLETGLITLKLARDDYDPNTLLSLTVDNVDSVISYARSSWDETVNEVRLNYTDRFDNFKDKPALAQDLANQRTQGQTISSNVSYVGISNSETAAKIAFRDLRNLTLPLGKVQLRTSREAYRLRPAQTFKLTWPEYDLPTTIFRVGRIGYGELENGIIEIDAIQDIFSLTDSLYISPPASSWTDPVQAPVIPTMFETVESPYLFSGDSQKIEVFAAKPNSGQLAFNTYSAVGSSSGTYVQVDGGDPYTPTGLLDSTYPLITSDVSTTDMVITATSPDMMNFLQNFTADYIKTGQNMFWLSDGSKFELMAFEEVLPDTPSAGKYTLSNIWRGLGDTVPVEHASGSRAWFFTYGEGLSNQNYTSGTTVYSKIQSIGGNANSALSSFDSVAIIRRSVKPYPPGKFQINASTSTVNISAGSDIVVAWEPRNRVTQGEEVIKQFATGIDAEPMTEYYIKFFNATNVLLRTVGPLTSTTYTYLNADQVSDNSAVEPLVVTVQLYSKRDGLFSLVPQQRTLLRPTGVAPSPPAYSPGADSYNPAPPSNTTSIGGIPVCTNTPTDGQVLTYDATAGCWKPANSAATLAGDVTGPTSANTVVRLQNRDLAATAPGTNQILGWSVTNNRWEPTSVSSVSSGSVVLTTFDDVDDTHTTNNTWEDVSNMNVAYTPTEFSSMFCTFTVEVAGITSANEHLGFRFVLDGATNSEFWIKQIDSYPLNNERHVITIHTVFDGISANTSHTVKVQWQDNNSGLDVTIYERRLSVIVCKSAFDATFEPDNVSGLQYWFKADELTGLSDNDPVSAMTDFSGNSRHFNASTSSPDTRGIYKINQQNGKPGVRFNHDGNSLTTTNTQYIGPSFTGSYTEGEIFVVMKATADPAASNIKGAWSTFGTDSNVCHYPFTDGTIYDDFGTNSRKNTGNPATDLATFNIYNVSSKASSWINRINGSVFFSTTSNTVAFVAAPRFGGNNAADSGAGFDGTILEVVLYNRFLNSTERAAVKTYLSAKYSI